MRLTDNCPANTGSEGSWLPAGNTPSWISLYN